MSQLFILRNLALNKSRLIMPTICVATQRCFNLNWRNLQKIKIDQDPDKNTTKLIRSTSGQSQITTDVRPLGEKIKENTKTASYVTIILAGVGITAVMLWTIFSELLSSTSPNAIYSKALERVKEDPRVQDALGAPIKGFGEESRRGRRQRVAHAIVHRNGVPHMRMQFYIQGIRNRATVQVETRENPSSGNIEYRYLIVQLDYYPNTTIILEDNRTLQSSSSTSASRYSYATPSDVNTSNLELASFKKNQ